MIAKLYPIKLKCCRCNNREDELTRFKGSITYCNDEANRYLYDKIDYSGVFLCTECTCFVERKYNEYYRDRPEGSHIIRIDLDVYQKQRTIRTTIYCVCNRVAYERVYQDEYDN